MWAFHALGEEHSSQGTAQVNSSRSSHSLCNGEFLSSKEFIKVNEKSNEFIVGE